ncbi:ABC transporter permease [Bacillus luteolus]|uniref:ABC transporter permease n=1 Tax=Litchfieldia luteola TaxID=682179 RepID=A0ABR9QF90_9BACI|nr:ABC transporter permease [Cytobacillus luteolus]MBE4907155.1 ABC transporter permease [Cytobacillus luteolus]MBP1943375.1 peptide/nickel transport system permease protein [Cytobacillus luteolus]
MTKYIIRRILQAIPLLIIISIITFLLMSLAPGDPTAMYENPEADSTQDLSVIREQLGLDQPIYIQYYKWLKLLVLEGNMGYSFEDGRPVMEKIFERAPATMTLVGTAILLSTIIAIPIGVYSAVKQYSKVDYFFTGYAFLGIAVPQFFIALIVILVFSLHLGWFPASGMRENYDAFDLWDRLYHLTLPALTLAFGLIATKTRFMRSSMLEVIKQDFIRTARAKGLTENKVIFKHALRNSLLPIITILALQLPALLGGALFIEQLFAWPGLGRLTINAIFIRDYQVIMGTTMIVSVMVVCANLVADILYAIVDPRIQYSKN